MKPIGTEWNGLECNAVHWNIVEIVNRMEWNGIMQWNEMEINGTERKVFECTAM